MSVANERLGNPDGDVIDCALKPCAACRGLIRQVDYYYGSTGDGVHSTFRACERIVASLRNSGHVVQ